MDPERLCRALHPLDRPPGGPGWNRSELDGLVDDDTTRDAAVLVGLVMRESGLHVLLTTRNAGLRQHAGQVSFPGGRVDPDDTNAVAAALRETWEEIGVAPDQVRPLGFLDPLATVTGYRVLPVVAHIQPHYIARPDPAEVADVFEVPLDFLLDPRNLVERRYAYRGRDRTVWEYSYPTQRIWGATASMLLNLRQRLEART